MKGQNRLPAQDAAHQTPTRAASSTAESVDPAYLGAVRIGNAATNESLPDAPDDAVYGYSTLDATSKELCDPASDPDETWASDASAEVCPEDGGEGTSTRPPAAPPAPPEDDFAAKQGALLRKREITSKREAEDFDGDAALDGSLTGSLHDNGAALDGTAEAGAESDNDEGMKAGASVEIGGGLSAYASVIPRNDGKALVVVTIEASGSVGGNTSFSQDDQDGTRTTFGGGLGASGSASGQWDSAEVVEGAVARAFTTAWSAGDAVGAIRLLASTMAIAERIWSGEATDVSTEGLQPGEARRSETSLEGTLCLSANWARFAVSGSASDKGTAERRITATPDGYLDVLVRFAGETTLQAKGGVDLGTVKLSGGMAKDVSAGLTARFRFLGQDEREQADEVLAAPRRTVLEELMEAYDWALTSKTVEDREKTSSSHGLGSAGASATWSSSSERHDAIVTGLSGMDGSTVSGSSSDAFSVAYGDLILAGQKDTSALDASVNDGEMNAMLTEKNTTSFLGIGLPSLDALTKLDWPAAFEEAFGHSHTELTKVSLTDDEITDIVYNRVYDVASWAQCARTIATHQKWIATGAAIRSATPHAEWVRADERMANLLARMQHLADFVASTSESAEVIDNLTQHFGQLGEVKLEYQRIGTLETWPAGTEQLREEYDELVPRIEKLDAQLAVLSGAGDTDTGLRLTDGLRDELQRLQDAVARTEVEDTDKQMHVMEDLSKVRVDLEWQRELFARSSGECPQEGQTPAVDSGDGFVEDGRQREAWVLWTTMGDYQRIEKRIFEKFGGRKSIGAMHDYLSELKILYRRWKAASTTARTMTADSATAMREPAPDWAGAEETLETLGGFTANAKPLAKMWPGLYSYWSTD